MITRINELASLLHTAIFWYTPYDKGNLARSIGDVQSFGANAVGFIPFDKNQSAPYGALLNEVPVIKYKVRNPKTGTLYEGSYVNKHYKWVDNFAEIAANLLPLIAPIRRVK